uniref:CSON009304 protein n=1 Tax=Culicoides sonorensis TaxID=179676 RepID=A0A336M025_CULSO
MRFRMSISFSLAAARCNGGPGPQQSVSTPCFTRTAAISSWPDSKALHSGQSPLSLGAFNATPRLHNASTTFGNRQWIANCNGDSCSAVSAFISAPCFNSLWTVVGRAPFSMRRSANSKGGPCVCGGVRANNKAHFSSCVRKFKSIEDCSTENPSLRLIASISNVEPSPSAFAKCHPVNKF